MSMQALGIDPPSPWHSSLTLSGDALGLCSVSLALSFIDDDERFRIEYSTIEWFEDEEDAKRAVFDKEYVSLHLDRLRALSSRPDAPHVHFASRSGKFICFRRNGWRYALIWKPANGYEERENMRTETEDDFDAICAQARAMAKELAAA